MKQVGRELGIRYVLKGGVRKSANQIRITAQLIDATTGAHIWAERYDRDLTDIFAVQDEITECVAGAIEPELLKIEGRAAISRTENLNAWDTVRQGMWHFHQVRRENALRARELFREAIKLDPKLPEAHLWLSRVSGSLLSYGWSSDRAADLQEGTEAALKAVQLDERDPYAHYALAITSVFAGALERASRAAETAIALSPSFALGHLALGFARLLAGKAAEAVGAFEHGLRLSPFDPQNFVWLGNLALAQYFSGHRETALQTALRSFSIRPDWVPALVMLAICCAALERLDEARAFVEQMRQLESGCHPNRVQAMPKIIHGGGTLVALSLGLLGAILLLLSMSAFLSAGWSSVLRLAGIALLGGGVACALTNGCDQSDPRLSLGAWHYGMRAHELYVGTKLPGAGGSWDFEKQPHAKCRTYPILSDASVFG